MTIIEKKPLLSEISNTFQQKHGVFKSFRLESVAERKTRLRKLRTWVKANQQAIREAMHADFRKPAAEVDTTEILPVLDEIKQALDNLDRWAQAKKVDASLTMLGTRSVIMYEPKGVCLIVSPWNYPFNLSAGPLVSALAAGNVVILKPSEMTPHTSALISRMCREVFTQNEVSVFEGGTDVSQELLKLPFDHIFFTGSPSVGKIVMRAAAENLASVTLELGGKSPTIVLPSANAKEAAQRIAVTKFINNGQTCIAPDYVLAHESIAGYLIKHLKEQIPALFGGTDKKISNSPDYARIVNEKHFSRLSDMLRDAESKGATVETGGQLDFSQRFFEPVVLSNVSHASRVMEEEIFGPILPILTYQSLDEIIQYINARPKPLALYVFGTRQAEITRIKKETSSGTVCVNDCAIQFLHPNLPFGGVNTSGIGKSHGYYGFLAFSNEKPVLRQRTGLTAFRFFYPPYTPGVQRMIGWVLKLF
ncbi:MAG: aldehyde dehydrogenase family protein [Cyclobacteriaceae bacterium]|nr:aldehyde dehydrogenase family protein [Cyclobacteriaceae bacterium]